MDVRCCCPAAGTVGPGRIRLGALSSVPRALNRFPGRAGIYCRPGLAGRARPLLPRRATAQPADDAAAGAEPSQPSAAPAADAGAAAAQQDAQQPTQAQEQHHEPPAAAPPVSGQAPAAAAAAASSPAAAAAQQLHQQLPKQQQPGGKPPKQPKQQPSRGSTPGAGGPTSPAAATAAKAAAAAAAARSRGPRAGTVPPFSLRAALAPLAQLGLGLASLLQAWLSRWLLRAGVASGVLLLGLHLLLNKALVPLANRALLPGLLADASRLSMREVSVGGVTSVSLPGLVGLGPLVTLQGVEVGPGPAEKSFLQVPEVTISLLPGVSMSQQRLVLQVTALRPHVTAVQGANFSWLGYPGDTTPSSRDFLPGLTAAQEQQQQQQEGEGPTDGEDGGAEAASAEEGEEGSEGSEGSGATLGSQRSVGRSSSSSASSAGGWRQQGPQVRGPPFAAMSAPSSSGRDDGDNLWNWWRQKQQQQQQQQQQQASQPHGSSSSSSSPQQQPTSEVPTTEAPTFTASEAEEGPSPSSEPGPSSSSGAGGDATDTDLQHPQQQQQHPQQQQQQQQQQQLAERLASHASASSSGRTPGDQQPQQQHHYSVRSSRQQSARDRLAALRLRRQQRQQQQQQQLTGSDGSETATATAGSTTAETHEAAAAAAASGKHHQQPRQQQAGAVLSHPVRSSSLHAGSDSPHSSSQAADSQQEEGDVTSTLTDRHAGPTQLSASTGHSKAAAAAAAGAAALPSSDEAVWGSASSRGRAGSASSGAAHTGPDTSAAASDASDEYEGSSSSAAYRSEVEDTDLAAAAASIPPHIPHHHHQQPPQQLPPQQQQQVEAASVLSSAQGWLSQRFRVAGSAVARSLGRRLSEGLRAASSRLVPRIHFPPPALHRVVVSQGTLDVQVWGEPIMRCVRDVGVLVTLGPDYSWLEVQVEGDAEPRHPASVKCTSINPAAKRHLRHVTPGSSSSSTRLRRFECDVLPQPQPPAAAAAVAGGAGAAGGGQQALQVLALEGAAAGSGDAGVVTASAAGSTAEAAAADAAGSIDGVVDTPRAAADSDPGSDHTATAAAAAEASDSVSGGPSVPLTAAAAAGGTGSSAQALPTSHPIDIDPTSHTSSSSSSSGLPLEPLQLPSGQLGLTHNISFLLPEELQQQQGAAQHGTALLPQKGGGHLSVRVFHRWAQSEEECDNLLLSVFGRGLSAPLIERLLELPFDIHSGVVDGEIHVAANDDATWEFPAVTGKLTCKDVDLHFWDATDELLGCQMDLLFERDRVYLHKAHGHYGAVPLSVSGDMDLNPLGGQYRLQAAVGPVEVNALRATLGVRPIPFPIAGALRGVLHLTGPLDKPIFSGSASALRPPPALLVGVEDTPALQALLGDPSAVVAYDRVPASAANGVFTLDTATEMFVLHSGQAVPAGGGLIQAAGRMWVAAAAESDPRAIAMEAGGNGLNAGALAKPYILPPEAPPGSPTPHAATVLAGAGPLNVRGSLTGSHLAPTTRVDWAAPSSGVTGSAQFSPTALSVACSGGGQFSLRGSAAVSNPTMDQARNANTQVEATYYGTPRVEAFQLEGSLNGVDLLPLMQTAPTVPSAAAAAAGPGSSSSSRSGGALFGAEAPPALVDGSRVRLKVTGGLRLSASRDESVAARRQAGLTGDGEYLFTGPVVLDGLRINQLSVARRLAGDMALTEPRLLLQSRGPGRRGDELLELDLALPPSPLALRPAPGPDGQLPLLLYRPPGFGAAHVVQPAVQAVQPQQQGGDAGVIGRQRQQGQVEGAGGEGSGEGGEAVLQMLEGADAAAAAAAEEAAAVGLPGGVSVEAQRVSHVLLRRGDLHFSSTVNASGTAFAAALESLPLDELELGSLRGVLVGAVLDVDLTSQTGRLTANMASPRFSGLAGTSLSTAARWERDVVLLERAVLTQPNSRYELAAEYILPPAFSPPSSIQQAQQAAASATTPQPDSHHHHHKHHHKHHKHHHHQQQQGHAAAAAAPSPEDGRWRVQLVVPHAAVEELLPAGQLLRQASRRSARDYSLAKSHFLSGLAGAAISAGEEFSSQVAALAEAAAVAAAAAAAAAGQPLPAGNEASSSATASALSLPGLQELRGTWSGRITAVGGGGAAAAAGGEGAGREVLREVGAGSNGGSSGSSSGPQVEFDISGSGWRAGPYTLDQLSLRGSADASEGMSLEELKLVVGQAQLSAKGLLGGRQQDAVFALSDFPAVLLQPLFSALPALQHAAPALHVRGGSPGAAPPGSSSSSGSSSTSVIGAQASAALSGLTSRLEASLASLGLRLPAGARGAGGLEGADPLEPFLASPVSGLLNVRGVLGGSAAAPTGLIRVKLLDGALGRQRLARSTASLALNSRQQLTMDVELAPADSHGYVKLAGSIDLLGPAGARGKEPGDSSSSSSSSRGEDAAGAGDAQAAAVTPGSTAAEVQGGSSGGSGSKGKRKKGRGAVNASSTTAVAAPTAGDAAHTSAAAAAPAAATAATASSSSSSEPHLELGVSVRDGGMSLLTSLAPGLTWGGGSASLNFAATGPAAAPVLTGSANFSKGSLGTSVLKHPLTALTGSLAVDGDSLAVSSLEAKVGPKGTLSIRGSLPLMPNSSASSSSSKQGGAGGVGGDSRLHAVASGVELRVRNMYSGSLDADLDLRGSLATPVLGGRVVFRQGTAFLVPPAGGPSGPEAAAAAAAAPASSSSSSQAELVRTAFAALKAGRARAATAAAAATASQLPVLLPGQQLMPFMPPTAAQPSSQTPQQGALLPAAGGAGGAGGPTGSADGSPAGAGTAAATAPAPALQLCGLELVLGPELRAVFPVVLNVGVSGNLLLSGNPAQPNGLLPAGVIRLEGGVLNLVATQFRFERDHPNSITFTPEAGLDPLLDIALSSSELRALIAGRASAWQDHLSLTASGPAAAAAAAAAGGSGAGGGGGGGAAVGGGEGGLAGDVLGSRAVARVFEGRLAEALLADDGSLSLATLAGNTLGSLLPKLETQGQLGKARWRLVSAASLPSLLMSTDPQASGRNGRGASTASDAGPRLLRSLALGTEVEVALGKSLVAALSHNMPASASDAGEAGMEVKLSLAITRQLRLLMQQRGLRLAPLVLLQFSSEGIPGAVQQ